MAALLAASLGAAGGTSATLALTNRSGGVTIVEQQAVARTVSSSALTGVAAVAQKLGPSIVRIDVTGSSGAFGRSSTATGSGVIFTSDGYILTNNHVVEGATSIRVTLSDGTTLAATLVGTAWPTDDIAVVKVNRKGLTAATLGSTSSVGVGDVAVAVGSPYGLQGTVTGGVISALHRNIDLGGGETLTDAIQTDAPINPGNSGGALSDAAGDVIGINTAIVSSSDGSTGVGFAIPIDIARRDAEQIIAGGHARRPYLGISGENAADSGGALVQQVASGGPADAAGLKVGDVVVALGGTKITSMDALIAALYRYDVGSSLRVTYLRSGARHTTTLKLGSTSSSGQRARRHPLPTANV
ncbi:MAG: PDZ domain-containing protein [Actinobacteria bacterium]|nr:MAG: PDZ domain-containing protein [Actinomycetota bacterium]